MAMTVATATRREQSGELAGTAANFGQDGSFSYWFVIRNTGRKRVANVTVSSTAAYGRFGVVPAKGVPADVSFVPQRSAIAVSSARVPEDNTVDGVDRHGIDTTVRQGKRSLSRKAKCTVLGDNADSCIRGVVAGRRVSVSVRDDSGGDPILTSLEWA